MRFLSLFLLLSLLFHFTVFGLLNAKNGLRILFKGGTGSTSNVPFEIVSTPKSRDGMIAKKTSPPSTLNSPGALDGQLSDLPAPEYPELSRLRSEEGQVLVLIVLDPERRLHEAKVLQSSGYPLLDQAAINALESLPKAEGQAPRLEHRVQFTFKLNNVN